MDAKILWPKHGPIWSKHGPSMVTIIIALDYLDSLKFFSDNLSQEPPISSKAPNNDLRDMDDLCNFKVKMENLNLENECINQYQQHQNQDPNAKP